MKRIISIALIALLAAPAAITVSWLKWQKHLVKKQVKWKMIEGLQDEELVHLVFDQNEILELRWEHSREFEYRGEMYDVVRSENVKGVVHYWCWHDHEETSLNKRLTESVQLAWGKNPRRDHQQDRLSWFFKSLYFALPGGCEHILCEQAQTVFGAPNMDKGLLLGPDGPPPRL